MISIGDAMLKLGVDTKDFDRNMAGVKDKLLKHSRAIGIGMTAVGVAGLKIIDTTKELNAKLGVTALNLGITTKEMRDLALGVTNVTFPIKEVIGTFDLLARAGVEDQQVLQDVATAFDTLGDAIGISASDVTKKLIPTMKTFGLTATEMADKTDALTYLFRNTTVSLDDFNRMVGYVTPDLVKMGLTTEDMIAILAELEEQGYSGEVMTREFRKAVTLATKEQIPLNEALGISTEKIESYKGELEGATGITQEYADVANEQYTILDGLKQKWSELTLGASGFLEPLEPVLAGMTALGPLMIGLSTNAGAAAINWALHTAALVAHKIASLASAIAIKVVTAAQWLWNAALSANPIGLVIVAIGLLIAAGVLLSRNWDKVVDFLRIAWANIKIFFLEGVRNVLATLGKFTSFIPILGDKVKEAHDAIANMIEAEKIERDVIRVNKALKENEAALSDNQEAIESNTAAVDPAYLQALQDEQGELLLTQEALEDQAKAYENLLEKAKDAVKQFQYQRSEAGKLGVTTRDVTTALIDQGWTIEALADLWEQLGDDVNYADLYLKAAGLTADEVDAILKRLEGTVDGLSDSYEELAEAAAKFKPPTPEEPYYPTPEIYPPPIPFEKMEVIRYGLEHGIAELIKFFPITYIPLPWLTAMMARTEEELQQYLEYEKALAVIAGATGLEMMTQAYKDAVKRVQELQWIQTELARRLEAGGWEGLIWPEEGAPFVPPEPKPEEYGELAGYVRPRLFGEYGGIAMRPITVGIAEKRPEALIPLDRLGGMLGGREVNIYVELNGEIIARVLGEPLVEEIRVRTGVHI